MIISLKQRQIKFKPRIKLNHNIYCTLSWRNLYLTKESVGQSWAPYKAQSSIFCTHHPSPALFDAVAVWLSVDLGLHLTMNNIQTCLRQAQIYFNSCHFFCSRHFVAVFDPLTSLLNSAGVASSIFISDWFKFSRLILHIQLALTKFGIFADIDTIDVNLGEYYQPRTITHSSNCSISSYHCTSSNNC